MISSVHVYPDNYIDNHLLGENIYLYNFVDLCSTLAFVLFIALFFYSLNKICEQKITLDLEMRDKTFIEFIVSHSYVQCYSSFLIHQLTIEYL